MGAKAVPLIEKKRIVDEVVVLKKKMTLNKACEATGVSVAAYWNYRKSLKKAGMMDKPHDNKKDCKPDKAITPKSNSVIKIFLQDASFILTEGSFEIKENYLGFEGKGRIEIDNK